MKESNGFGSFSISDVGKTFRDKSSSGESLFSPDIEILGIKWGVAIVNEENEFFGIFLFREVKEK